MADPLQTMRLRYGEAEIGTPLTRLQLKLHRNRARREAIRTEVESLLDEERRLTIEAERLEALRVRLVEEEADRIRERNGEGWSPVPIIGFRMWAIERDRVVGATGHVWDEASQEARCARSRGDDDLPHTDHQCSSVGHGCGIYAASDPSHLPWPGDTDYVAGVVLLSGKVVEHERGYRAARARVAGAIVRRLGRVLVTTERERLDLVFRSPLDAVIRFGAQCPAPDPIELCHEMERLREETRQWT